MEHYDFALSAERLKRAWEGGHVCSLMARAARARVLRAEAAWRAGLMTHEEAVRAAREAVGVAFMFAPLPARP